MKSWYLTRLSGWLREDAEAWSFICGPCAGLASCTQTPTGEGDRSFQEVAWPYLLLLGIVEVP